jgi:hypothetical protein
VLKIYAIYSAIKASEGEWDFALKEKVDYILYSPNIHKRTAIEPSLPPG